MVQTPSRKFCCCLPVRFGVFVLAMLGLLGGTVVASVGIFQITRTKVGQTFIVIQVVMYLLLAIVSFFGLLGAITRRRKLVAIYWAMLTAHLVFSVITGIYVLHSFFKYAPQNTQICIGGSDDPDTISACSRAETAAKAVMTSVIVFIWLIQIYACIIVDNYTKQLADEEDAHFKEEVGRPTW